MPKTDQQRKAKQRRVNADQGRREFPMAPGTLAALERVMARAGYEDWRELLTMMIHNMDQMDDLTALLALPRHTYDLEKYHAQLPATDR